MKKYIAVLLVLMLSCGLVGYGGSLPMEASGDESVILVEETAPVQPQAKEGSSAALTSTAAPSLTRSSFSEMGTSLSLRQIVEPVVTYMDEEVTTYLQAEEELRLQKEAELANRDESQRVYSTAMVGSVIAVEDMIPANAAPLDLSTVVFSTTDASGAKSLFFNEDGVMKVWREQTEGAKTEKGAKEESTEIQEISNKEESSEESYEEASYQEPEEESYEEESYEEPSYNDYEEESSEEESYEEESEEESYVEESEESSEEESSEEESYEEEESSEEEEEESSENTEDEDEDEESSETTEDEEEEEEEVTHTYEIPTDGEYYYGYAEEVFAKTNALRASLGIAPLSWSGELESFAMTRAQEITVSFSHYRPGGGHYSNYGPEHENIAWGYGSPEAVFEGWATSYDHYNNLTDTTMSSVGIACYRYEGILYWVMSFW